MTMSNYALSRTKNHALDTLKHGSAAAATAATKRTADIDDYDDISDI